MNFHQLTIYFRKKKALQKKYNKNFLNFNFTRTNKIKIK